jgi:hypothetical protein
MDPMKSSPEMIEGPEAYKHFDATVDSLLAVPRKTIMRRERAYRKKVAANPRASGRKPQVRCRA